MGHRDCHSPWRTTTRITRGNDVREVASGSTSAGHTPVTRAAICLSLNAAPTPARRSDSCPTAPTGDPEWGPHHSSKRLRLGRKALAFSGWAGGRGLERSGGPRGSPPPPPAFPSGPVNIPEGWTLSQSHLRLCPQRLLGVSKTAFQRPVPVPFLRCVAGGEAGTSCGDRLFHDSVGPRFVGTALFRLFSQPGHPRWL